MPTKTFDAGKYLTDLNGRDYLEVKWRLLWLRTEHPDAVIETELVKQSEGLALFRARVAVPGGGVATGWGSETADDFRDYIEKAETKALGRALAALGFGTQFCEDYDFSAERRSAPDGRRNAPPPSGGRTAGGGTEARREQRVVDAPVARRTLKVVRDRASEHATASQVKAIYAIGRRQQEEGDAGVERRCRETYGCLPAELSKRHASEFIDLLRKPNADAPPED
jgi:hypothetical protein